jgi:hypothetical protein
MMVATHRPAVGRVGPVAAVAQGDDVVHLAGGPAAAGDAACRVAAQVVGAEGLPVAIIAAAGGAASCPVVGAGAQRAASPGERRVAGGTVPRSRPRHAVTRSSDRRLTVLGQ